MKNSLSICRDFSDVAYSVKQNVRAKRKKTTNPNNNNKPPKTHLYLGVVVQACDRSTGEAE
jgi:hypothetical protein